MYCKKIPENCSQEKDIFGKKLIIEIISHFRKKLFFF